MRKLLQMAFAVAFITALAVSGFAQTATTQTVLSAAIANANVTTITVASATGITASTQSQDYNVWVDGELMKVLGVSGTTLTVRRGVASRATSHPTGSVLFFGPAGAAPFVSQDPTPGTNCTATAFQFLPLVNVSNGNVITCTGSRWHTLNFRQWQYGHPVTIITDAAYTATLADEFIVYQKATTGRTVTLPAITGIIGKVYTIAQPLSTAQTITIQGSAGQLFGTSPTAASITMTNTPTRVMSVLLGTATWGWITW